MPSLRPPGGGARYTPLLRRVFAVNAVVLIAASAVTVAVLARGDIGAVAAEEAAILAASLAVMLAVNLLLLRTAFAPLARLTRLARTLDPSRPGQRIAVTGPESEATELGHALNDMLARLEHERRESTRRVLAAQEAERLRVARELHDEVGQTLTAVVLQLSRAGRHAGPEVAGQLGEAQDAARASLDDVRRIALELRPEALDDLGLGSALVALAERVQAGTGLRVRHDIARDLPALGEEQELVIYRVAQEALTNVARHSGSATAELRLRRAPDRVVLDVLDEGRGLQGAPEGGGLRGMRERAQLVGATLEVRERESGGLAVRLDLPSGEGGLWYR